MELSVSVFKCVWNYGCYLQKHAKIRAHFWKNTAKLSTRAKEIRKLFNYSVCLEKFALPCGVTGLFFIMLMELWDTFVQTYVELWVPNVNQNDTSPSKIFLGTPE